MAGLLVVVAIVVALAVGSHFDRRRQKHYQEYLERHEKKEE